MARLQDASRDLLLALLALQNDMVDRDQLLSAHLASTGSDRSLADVLEDCGVLRPGRRVLLEALVDAHLELHGGDAGKSLSIIDPDCSTRGAILDGGTTGSQSTIDLFSPGPVENTRGVLPDRSTARLLGDSTSQGQRFRLLRPYARGGLGEVFVALDHELNREVALKQILEHHADDPRSRQRFLLEARVTGGLEHPGIVPVYGLGTYRDGRPYYAMRFVKGESLKEVIEKFHGEAKKSDDLGIRSLEIRKLLRRFIDVCNAVDYAHSRGVLHRDIKPSNVIVGRHGETLLIDWGLAKATGKVCPGPKSGERPLNSSANGDSADTVPGSAMGTPAFMSPEQARGDLDALGPHSDVYSLGATLYHILTGKVPFRGDVDTVLARVRAGDFPPPRSVDPSIDSALEAVCLKAMATIASDRYDTGRALADDVERWMADEPVTAWTEPVLRRAGRWARRNRSAVTGTTAALVAGLVGLVAVLAVQSQANAALALSLRRETRVNEALGLANEDLTRSRAAVQERYDLSVEAIKTFYTGVSEDFLLKEDQFKELRDRLLKSAADFYARLGALLGRESDLGSRRALAQANFEVAELTLKVGRREEALKEHRKVLATREDLAAQAEVDPDVRMDVGESLISVASLLESTGDTAVAEATYRQAEAILSRPDGPKEARGPLADCRSLLGHLLDTTARDAEALAVLELAKVEQEAAAAEPGSTNASRLALAMTLHRISFVLDHMGRVSEPEFELRRALVIYQKLADDNPSVAEFRYRLIIARGALCTVLERLQRLEDAEAERRKTLAIARELAGEHQGVTEFQSQLARCHVSLGLLLSESEKSSEAPAEYRVALAIMRKLADEHPSVPEFLDNLAITHGNLAIVLRKAGLIPDAVIEYKEALVVQRKLADDHPTLVSYRSRLALTYNNFGILLKRANRFSEAEVEFRNGLEIRERLFDEHPTFPEFQMRLADSLLSMGNLQHLRREFRGAATSYRRGIALLEGLAALAGGTSYDLAALRAQLASLAGEPDADLSASEGRAEADRALEDLRRAIDLGFRDLATFRDDTDLDPLRGREDFQLLLLDLAMPADPFRRDP